MKSKNVRYFFTSMITTLCIIVFGFGIVAVDYNTRWIGFGNDAPIACVVTTQSGAKELEINAMGAKKAINITAGYRFVHWAEQSGQQTADLAVSIYTDICKMLSQQNK